MSSYLGDDTLANAVTALEATGKASKAVTVEMLRYVLHDEPDIAAFLEKKITQRLHDQFPVVGAQDRLPTTDTVHQVAALPIDNPVGDSKETIEGYLRLLLRTLWTEAEGFSGKRPFGNGGWQLDVYRVLVENNIIKGTIDKDGDLQDVDEVRGEVMVLAIIDRLTVNSGSTSQ